MTQRIRRRVLQLTELPESREFSLAEPVAVLVERLGPRHWRLSCPVLGQSCEAQLSLSAGLWQLCGCIKAAAVAQLLCPPAEQTEQPLSAAQAAALRRLVTAKQAWGLPPLGLQELCAIAPMLIDAGLELYRKLPMLSSELGSEFVVSWPAAGLVGIGDTPEAASRNLLQRAAALYWATETDEPESLPDRARYLYYSLRLILRPIGAATPVLGAALPQLLAAGQQRESQLELAVPPVTLRLGLLWTCPNCGVDVAVPPTLTPETEVPDEAREQFQELLGGDEWRAQPAGRNIRGMRISEANVQAVRCPHCRGSWPVDREALFGPPEE